MARMSMFKFHMLSGEYQVKKEWLQTTFKYNDEGIKVRVPNVYTWACPENGC